MATVDDLKRHMGAVFSDNYESLNQFCLIVLNSLAWQFATGRGFYLTPSLSVPASELNLRGGNIQLIRT